MNTEGLPTVDNVFPFGPTQGAYSQKHRIGGAGLPARPIQGHKPTRDQLGRKRRPTRGSFLDAAGLPAAISCTEGLPSLETN